MILACFSFGSRPTDLKMSGKLVRRLQPLVKTFGVDMRYGIPLLARRVAPRITTADSFLVVTIRNHRITSKDFVPLEAMTWIDLPKFLTPLYLDVLICGGIDKETKKTLLANALNIIDNVACTAEDVLQALVTNSLHPGYGFQSPSPDRADREPGVAGTFPSDSGETARSKDRGTALSEIDCVLCGSRVCLRGRSCPSAESLSVPAADARVRAMLDAAADITFEEERTLCRISELVYFGLEMKYRKIGIAFCADLLEPTEILTELLRRHFDVFPVICKVGGMTIKDPLSEGSGKTDRKIIGRTACNPLGQAEVLNQMNTDLNVIVGLCMGLDCLFTKASLAPVTTLFVKDKSLANNPIGALYSEYYLKEVSKTPVKIL